MKNKKISISATISTIGLFTLLMLHNNTHSMKRSDSDSADLTEAQKKMLAKFDEEEKTEKKNAEIARLKHMEEEREKREKKEKLEYDTFIKLAETSRGREFIEKLNKLHNFFSTLRTYGYKKMRDMLKDNYEEIENMDKEFTYCTQMLEEIDPEKLFITELVRIARNRTGADEFPNIAFGDHEKDYYQKLKQLKNCHVLNNPRLFREFLALKIHIRKLLNIAVSEDFKKKPALHSELKLLQKMLIYYVEERNKKIEPLGRKMADKKTKKFTNITIKTQDK